MAFDAKATYWPSSLMAGVTLRPWAGAVPALITLTRVVVPAPRSWTKTSGELLASPATRLEASDVKATYRPSALDTDGSPAAAGPSASDWPPPVLTLARLVAPVESGRLPAGRGTRTPTAKANGTRTASRK